MAHSLSPALHRAGYAALGLGEWTYEAIECDDTALPSLVSGLSGEWVGLSVTMPGKAAAARFANDRSARVDRLGVANTLVRTADGWAAENTDVDGVLGAMRAAGVGVPERVLILGGGGTALAVVAAMAETAARPELVLAGRRPESTSAACDLASVLGLRARPMGIGAVEIASAATEVGMVVSTVPAGAADHLAPALAGVPVLFDVIYHPWPTALAAAGSADRITVTGLDMLLHQALRQFELFTGRSAPAEAMRDGLRKASGTSLPLPLN